MSAEEPKYKTMSVRAIRGLETRTIAKWQKEGWELVSQSTGKIQTEIHFRQLKDPKALRKGILLVGGAVVLLAAIIGTGIALSPSGPEEETPGAPETAQVAPPTASAEEGTQVLDETPIETPVLTIENSPELATTLKLGDYCDESLVGFARDFAGQTIEFDGNIGAMNNHGDYKTRYDILVGSEDYSETSQPGPAFQLRDVNPTFDLHIAGENPGSLSIGQNIRLSAEIVKYEPQTCLFLLDPVETTFR